MPYHGLPGSLVRSSLLCCFGLVVAGCSGLLEPPGVSLTIRVSVRTVGPNQDADGYTVSLDGRGERSVGVNGEVEFSGVNEYDHMVTLTGIATNCRVQGENPVTVSMSAGTFAGLPSYSDKYVELLVACDWNATLKVTTVTTGTNLDPDIYVLKTFCGFPGVSCGLPVNESRVFGPFVAGPINIELAEIAPNCSLAGENPRQVVLVHNVVVETVFQITCT